MLGIKTKKDRIIDTRNKEIIKLLTDLLESYFEINILRNALADLRLGVLTSRKVTDDELIEGVLECVRQQF